MFGRARSEPQYEVVATFKGGLKTNKRTIEPQQRRWGPMSRPAAEEVVVQLSTHEDVVEARIEPVKE